MKSYRNAAAALLLAFVLSTSAVAGEIHTDGSPAPPPATDGVIHTDGSSTPTPTVNGEMQTGATGGEIHTGMAETLTQVALNVLAVLPSLL